MNVFENKRIFLTGGTGFFGKSILHRLKSGWLPTTEFTVLSRDPERFLSSCPEFADTARVHFLRGDVRDFRFPERSYDYVIHAATPAVTDLPPGETRSVILEGTARVLEFAQNREVKKLLFTSSGAVYGIQPPDIVQVPETHPCKPVTEYGIAKLEAESLCQKSGIPATIARCFAFTGPYLNRNIHFAIGNFIRDALSGKPILIKGDGTPLRSYLYANDLVEWLFFLLGTSTPDEIYNVGSPDAVSIAELAHLVKAALNSDSSIIVCHKADSGTPPARYVPSVDRAQRLGLKIKVPLREAIRRSAGYDELSSLL